MDRAKMTAESSVDGAVHLLRQILQFYKEMGPQSMESLTKSYLSSAPTAETAKDAAEAMKIRPKDLLEKLAAPVVHLLGLVQSRFRAYRLSARPLDIGRQRSGRYLLQVGIGVCHGSHGLVTLCSQVSVIQLGQYLACRNVVAFPDQQLPDRRCETAADVCLLTGEYAGGSPYDDPDIGVSALATFTSTTGFKGASSWDPQAAKSGSSKKMKLFLFIVLMQPPDLPWR